MNICQISSQDLLHCLAHDRLSEMPFFQQVLAIAQAEHLVSISDYAIAQFLEKNLPPADQQQLETLLELIDIWQTDPSDYDRAIALSDQARISIADAIDHVIYDSLCPDWLLVAETTRNLPNATGIQSFWQEWIDIRDDLPPSGGTSVPRPIGGGGPSGPGQTPDRSTASHSAQQSSTQPTAFNSSVIFTQGAYVNLSWSLLSHNAPASSQSTTTIALGENLPSPAATQLVQSLQAALPHLQVHLQSTASGWEVVIELPSGQPVQTLSLADLAGNRATMLSAALSQIPIVANAPSQGLIPTGSAVTTAIAQAVQAVTAPGTNQNDIIYVSQAPGANSGLINGGAGIDLVSYAQSPTGVTVDLSANQPLQNVENLEGSNFDDRLTGDPNDNVIIALAGNDTIIGNAGNDILQSNTGDNMLFGGSVPVTAPIVTAGKAPLITAGPASVTAKPSVERSVELKSPVLSPIDADTANTLTPENPTTPDVKPEIRDDDWIFAGSGDDVINAGEGNNFIAAGTGNNRITSGSGQDLFVLEAGPGVTQILHYQSHDRFGLLGGYHYDDLEITPAKRKETATQIRLKSATSEAGDILAIVVGVTPEQLDRTAFLTVKYDQTPGTQPIPSGPTQVIPDWLSASQQQGQTLHVPTLAQLAPTLRALPPLDGLQAA